MAEDPYHAVKAEIQTSLQTASTLRASYLRIASTASSDSEELRWAGSELKATLAALDADLEDLDESVRVLEETGGRIFGIEDSEVMSRRKYVTFVRGEIENQTKNIPYSDADHGATPEDDDQAEWARQEQQMMMEHQDSMLSTIGGTLSTLVEQAGLMGREIGEHNDMLSNLEAGVDRTQNKLNGAMKKLQKLIRDTEAVSSSSDLTQPPHLFSHFLTGGMQSAANACQIAASRDLTVKNAHIGSSRLEAGLAGARGPYGSPGYGPWELPPHITPKFPKIQLLPRILLNLVPTSLYRPGQAPISLLASRRNEYSYVLA
ncbi:hypothetical protein FRB90_007934 [Tulasnella sp. 427]|nr:hypothetical protein FRB90_007934 [Tulasnella sp. 427]